MRLSPLPLPPPLPSAAALLTPCLRWPVIIAIIIGSLIALSVLWCVVRCMCCGMSCCCTCFSFLKCCDCCGGCCDGRRDAPHKHLDEPGPFHSHQGYQPNPPMMGGGLGSKPSYEPPQFATFDVGKTGHAVSEDALPPMPSWETAQKKHVLSEEEKNGVELGELDPATGQKLPLMAGAAGTGISSPPTPSNEFHDAPFAAGGRPGMPGVAHGGPEDAYGQNRAAFNQSAQGYRGTPSPGPAMMGGRGYGPGQNGMDGYGPHRGASPGPNNGFADAAVGAVGAYPPNDRRQYPQPGRQYSGSNSGSSRPVNQGRQYSNGSHQQDGYSQNGYGPSRGPRSPPVNNGGFDFGIGNEQPQQPPYGAPARTYSPAPNPQPPFGGPARSYSPAPHQQPPFAAPGRSYSPAPTQQQRTGGGYSTGPPSYATRTPPPQEHSYQAYVPPSSPRPAASSSSAAGGRAREPEHWDPVHQ